MNGGICHLCYPSFQTDCDYELLVFLGNYSCLNIQTFLLMVEPSSLNCNKCSWIPFSMFGYLIFVNRCLTVGNKRDLPVMDLQM